MIGRWHAWEDGRWKIEDGREESLPAHLAFPHPTTPILRHSTTPFPLWSPISYLLSTCSRSASMSPSVSARRFTAIHCLNRSGHEKDTYARFTNQRSEGRGQRTEVRRQRAAA